MSSRYFRAVILFVASVLVQGSYQCTIPSNFACCTECPQSSIFLCFGSPYGCYSFFGNRNQTWCTIQYGSGWCEAYGDCVTISSITTSFDECSGETFARESTICCQTA
jgi:hypothetical protein